MAISPRSTSLRSIMSSALSTVKPVPTPSSTSLKKPGYGKSIPRRRGPVQPTSNCATRQHLAMRSRSQPRTKSAACYSSVPMTIMTTLTTYRLRASDRNQRSNQPDRRRHRKGPGFAWRVCRRWEACGARQ
ncbi:Vng6385h (plasmid) [Halobacterium salinarum NRC-1]|uniref:Spurious ORF n=1 Tax=Halobacterium salinarum (strain ATCC 700922 / JCM 11081 / NRC-1) TaxID=64091 RepID=Q9HHI0_HALSA|nr:Vng6385h [Halobacterium salinarum NRC-1]DAC79967.1 TPA_inf: spurious ORF [Halobacterium salinarum NRC-1]